MCVLIIDALFVVSKHLYLQVCSSLGVICSYFDEYQTLLSVLNHRQSCLVEIKKSKVTTAVVLMLATCPRDRGGRGVGGWSQRAVTKKKTQLLVLSEEGRAVTVGGA